MSDNGLWSSSQTFVQVPVVVEIVEITKENFEEVKSFVEYTLSSIAINVDDDYQKRKLSSDELYFTLRTNYNVFDIGVGCYLWVEDECSVILYSPKAFDIAFAKPGSDWLKKTEDLRRSQKVFSEGFEVESSERR